MPRRRALPRSSSWLRQSFRRPVERHQSQPLIEIHRHGTRELCKRQTNLAIERLMRWYSAASAVLHLPDDPRVPWRGARDSTAGDLSMRRAIVALAGAVIMVASPA